MNTIKHLIVIFFVASAIVSCRNPHIGKPVNMNSYAVCSWSSFPETCSVSYPKMDITYYIEKTENGNEYTVNSTAFWTGRKMDWYGFKDAGFTLLLINDGKIVEAVTMSGGLGNINSPIKFNSKFITTKSFHASAINYRMIVYG